MHSLDKIQRDNAEATQVADDVLDRELERILGEPRQVTLTNGSEVEFVGSVQAQLMLCRKGESDSQTAIHFAPVDEVTDEMVDRFKKAWHEADEAGLDGSRVRAGLQAVFEVVVLDAESVPE